MMKQINPFLWSQRLTTNGLVGAFFYLMISALPIGAQAERIKDIANVAGIRDNQLMGYGIVVGLDGTGDVSPLTTQGIISAMIQLGVKLPPGVNLNAKNIAGVAVTAVLPPFAQQGQTLDVTVSSLGSAKSLRGGTLLMTALKGADGAIYAMAQGNLLVGGAGASAGGSSVTVNHLNAGRIAAGATVEKTVDVAVGQGDTVALELREADFTTASRVVSAINSRFGQNTAAAMNGRVIMVRAPMDYDNRVGFLSDLQSLTVKTADNIAKVVLNGRTGSVVMNQSVTVKECAIAHGNLSVVISTNNEVSQPGAFSSGQTAGVSNSQIDITAQPGLVVRLPNSVLLADVVKALNSIGATPQDLLAILQAMKAAGSLNAELEII
jgi:flagellar P-ring protein precursor FlgI